MTGFEVNIHMSISYTSETKQISRKFNFENSFAIVHMKHHWESNPDSLIPKPTLQEYLPHLQLIPSVQITFRRDEKVKMFSEKIKISETKIEGMDDS